MLGLTKIAPGSVNVGLTQRPEPVAGTGHVVLAVQAAGICGTDLHIVDDEFASSPPVTMGHEVCGVVVEIGPRVDPSWLGERVVSETYFSTCGTCEHCSAGRRNLCHERRSIGSAVDGAFALASPFRSATSIAFATRWPRRRQRSPSLACVCQSLCDRIGSRHTITCSSSDRGRSA